MQPLPADFLAAFAKRYDLSPEQTDALIKRLGDEDNEQTDAESLHISDSALRSRMTGVYAKFSIGSGGPGKLRKLHDFLLDEYQKTTPTGVEPREPAPDIDALVKTIRAQVHGDIQARCGTMRVLDMERPIGLSDIYISVNILEKRSGNQRIELNELLQDFNPENFNCFSLNQVRQPPVSGLKAVEEHSKLIIFGKPGAGKTTFMKRLAILCNQGEFQSQRVPVLVTLKDYAEAKGKPLLQTYIQTQWQACGVEAADALSTILGNGKALVMLDSLDEVQKTDYDRVLQDIRTFTRQFRDCQCVITCRIAAREYTFEQFTEVEVADFDLEQIAEFATKWFVAKNDPEKAKTFIRRLKENKHIQELATNPLLLTLLCLVFGEVEDFPSNRAEFYKEGLDVMLKKWDGKRDVKRDQIYKKLSLKRKEDLLSQLAFTTFNRGDYFFKQTTVEQHIIQYICSIYITSEEEEEVLQLDAEAVLKSIEAQHGILVARARGIYSFSHLTFQEYLTARNIINQTSVLNQELQNLVSHITEKRYREIFLLTAEILPCADELLILMKRKIDQLMLNEPDQEFKLQLFLDWVQHKSISANASYKPSAIRAFYYDLFCGRAWVRQIERDMTLAIYRGVVEGIALAFNQDIEEINIDDARDHISTLDVTYCLDSGMALDLKIACVLETSLAFGIDSAHDINLLLDQEFLGQSNSSLKFKIQALSAALPSKENSEICKQWWSENGEAWAERLRAVMIEHRNIGHDWQFSKAQKEKLRQYYDANKLLVACLNSDCYVTKPTRQYIEDTLLLPLSEIEKYPVPDAIANL